MIFSTEINHRKSRFFIALQSNQTDNEPPSVGRN